MEERRKFVRVPDTSQVSYKVISEERLGEYIARDISQGGLRFFAHEFIPKGSLLKIRISSNEKVFSFEAMAKLVWIREIPDNDKYEVGVEFIDLPKNLVEYVINYIKGSLGTENR